MQLDDKTHKLLADPKNNYAKRRAWVIYHLKLQGQTLVSVAAANGVTKQQTQKALSAPYPRMEKLIADALGLTPQELFLERYDADGLPNRQRGRPKNSGVETSGDSKAGSSSSVNCKAHSSDRHRAVA